MNVRTDKPYLSIDEFGPIAKQLVCKPSCHCGGRGFTGIIKLPDGTLKLDKCKHAVWGETDFVLIMKYLDMMNQNIASARDQSYKESDLILRAIIDGQRLSFRYWIREGFRYIVAWWGSKAKVQKEKSVESIPAPAMEPQAQ